MAAKKEMENENESVRIISAAINRVQEQISHIAKDSSAPQYKYVGEVQLVEKIRPLVVAEGLVLSPMVGDMPIHVTTGIGPKGNGHLVVWVQGFRLTHTSGAIWPWPIEVMAEGLDYGDKAVWKGLTAAHKYAWIRLLNLATGEDPEGDRTADVVAEQGYAKAEPEKKSLLMKALDAARSSQSETARWVKKKGVEYELKKEDMERFKIYRYSFVAAEAKYGEATDGNKFDCLNDFKRDRGVNTQTLYAVDVLPFIKFATESWPGVAKGF